MNELATPTQADPKSPTLLALLTSALELVEASVSPNTRRAYSSAWQRFDFPSEVTAQLRIIPRCVSVLVAAGPDRPGI